MFGLRKLDGSGDLSLKSVAISCRIYNLSVGCNATLVYRNDTGQSAEGLFLFPRDRDCEMTFIRADVGSRTLLGQWKDTKEATAMVPYSIANGEKSVVLQYDKVSMPLVKFRVGTIPANTEVKITLKFVLELRLSPSTDKEVDQFSLHLPAILKPLSTQCASNDYQTYYVSNQYAYTLDATVSGTKEIKRVSSINHTLNFKFEGNQKTCAKVALQSLYDGKKDLDVSVVYTRSKNLSVMHTFGTISKNEVSGNFKGDIYKSDVAIVNLIPSFHSEKVELVFVLDRSDSMYGSEIQYAKDSLLIFLKSLPEDSMFQIYGFGSYYDKAFIKPQTYNDKSLKLAMDYHKKIAADYDGTDFMLPLQNMYGYPLVEGYHRIVFLLTDGDVTNKDEVLQLIKDNNTTTTLHSIGIGPVVSRQFIQQMAEAGNGNSSLVTDSEKLCSTFKDLFQSALDANEFIVEKVDWQCPNNVTVSTVPKVPWAALPNEYLNLLCIPKGVKDGDTLKGIFTIKMNGKYNQLVANIVYQSGTYDNEYTAQRLVAMYQIQNLVTEIDKGNFAMKDALQKLSKESNIETKYSVLVALDQRDPKKGLIVSEEMDPLQYYRPLFDIFSTTTDSNSTNTEESSSSYLPMQIWISDSYKMSSHGDIVIYIADKQNVNGSWDYDMEMAWRLGLDTTTIENEMPDVISMEIWITIIVFEFLSTTLKSREKEWQLLGKKAKEFISINIKESGIIEKIKGNGKYGGANDINSFIKHLTNKALLILNVVATTSSYITDKEIDQASSTLSAERQKFEIVFVIDRSGSMQGLKIESAKQCLFIFLKSLPENCKFQIYGFGTNFDKAFNEYRLYDDASIQCGLTYQYKIDASFRGTELLKPLQDLYSQSLTQGYIRLVFVLTDGQVSNESNVVDLVKRNNSTNKLYAIGIGKDVSVTLVKRIAESGMGKAAFVEESSILSSIVIDLLDEALNAH